MVKRALLVVALLVGAASLYKYLSSNCIEGNCESGYGIKARPGSYRYEGDFKSGLAHGKGSLILESGESYEGEWAFGRKEGKGTYRYIDGSSYIGSWSNNMRNGEGTLFDSDGKVSYQGKWKDGNQMNSY
ncbi:hypothetical protein CH373_02760 [Leptospira perolatii]|uniref:Membrane-binding protein n=1 Tax=Leptospira perolatii TaxID=2023191 RepID=A0A2M9ZSB3_9LEPT|nr:hypothetical protein [Leptospira perolatii]PJZ71436.1 hypothetical protein CH360_02760 [Leptospira perolatii]PJZ74970.1 hypothetical protein CH373_02760 [Leptospira perolatii]